MAIGESIGQDVTPGGVLAGARLDRLPKHADLWLCDLVADLFRSSRPYVDAIFLIHLDDLFGCVIGAFAADRIGRRPTIIGASLLAIVFGALYPNMMQPLLLVATGFCLLLAIYVLVALLYGVYTPELFPTELRLRANGICNMLGRGATIVSPFIVVTLFKAYGVAGVTSFMIGLLIVLIAAIWAWGVEPAGLALENIGPVKSKSDLTKVKSLVSKAR
jgi:MFS family permease